MSDLPHSPCATDAPPAPQSEACSAVERRALRTLWWAIEQSPAALMITDADGRVVYVNPRFSSLSGYGRTDILGD